MPALTPGEPDTSGGSSRSLPDRDRSVHALRISLYGFGLLLGTALLWTINAARYLRPSADDYCIGVRGNLGLVGGFLNDWQTFSGFATPSFITNALLGIPLARLPFSVALALPFLLAALSVAAAALWLVSSTLKELATRRRWSVILIGLAGIMTLWWAYLWMTYSSSGRPEPTSVALGLTHWQNLNTGYVIPISLVVILGSWLARGSFRHWYSVCGAGLLFGLVAGFAGPATALAVLVFAPVLTVGLWLLGDSRWWLKGLSTWPVTAVSLAISLTAPGTQSRSAAARSEAEVTLSSLPGWFAAVIPDGLIAWFSMYWQWRSLLVIGIGAVAIYAIRILSGIQSVSSIGMPWLGITLFALVLSTTTIVTDTLAYGAYWHQSNTTVLIFLSLLLSGVGIGSLMPVPVPKLGMFVLPLLLISFGLVTLAGVLDMSVSITDRYAEWTQGPAPIPGAIEDREIEWIGNCWEELDSIRDSR